MGCWKCTWHHRLRGKSCVFCVRVWDSSRLWWTFKRPTVVEQGTSQEATVAARLWKKNIRNERVWIIGMFSKALTVSRKISLVQASALWRLARFCNGGGFAVGLVSCVHCWGTKPALPQAPVDHCYWCIPSPLQHENAAALLSGVYFHIIGIGCCAYPHCHCVFAGACVVFCCAKKKKMVYRQVSLRLIL